MTTHEHQEARAWLTRWSPLPLRLVVGYRFMEHGLAKLSRAPEAFAGIPHALGVPAPHLMAWPTIAVEVLGGLAILLGADPALHPRAAKPTP